MLGCRGSDIGIQAQTEMVDSQVGAKVAQLIDFGAEEEVQEGTEHDCLPCKAQYPHPLVKDRPWMYCVLTKQNNNSSPWWVGCGKAEMGEET